ncbi:hypothetical protein K523DRAFT_323034, partial [Schizophyllum commune Tattone D]
AKNKRKVWLIAGHGTPWHANAAARPTPLTASPCTGSEHTSRVVRPKTPPTTTGSSIPALALVRLCPSVGTVGSECDGAGGEGDGCGVGAYLGLGRCKQDGVGAERSGSCP